MFSFWKFVRWSTSIRQWKTGSSGILEQLNFESEMYFSILSIGQCCRFYRFSTQILFILNVFWLLECLKYIYWVLDCAWGDNVFTSSCIFRWRGQGIKYTFLETEVKDRETQKVYLNKSGTIRMWQQFRLVWEDYIAREPHGVISAIPLRNISRFNK
jgi:hypothetical protein